MHNNFRITLTRLAKDHKKTANVDDMIGFYILKATEPNGEIKGDLRRAVTFETTFLPTLENTAEKDLQVGSGTTTVQQWMGWDGMIHSGPRRDGPSICCPVWDVRAKGWDVRNTSHTPLSTSIAFDEALSGIH